MIRITQGWIIVSLILALEIIYGFGNAYEFVRLQPVSAFLVFIGICVFSAIIENILDKTVYKSTDIVSEADAVQQ